MTELGWGSAVGAGLGRVLCAAFPNDMRRMQHQESVESASRPSMPVMTGCLWVPKVFQMWRRTTDCLLMNLIIVGPLFKLNSKDCSLILQPGLAVRPPVLISVASGVRELANFAARCQVSRLLVAGKNTKNGR